MKLNFPVCNDIVILRFAATRKLYNQLFIHILTMHKRHVEFVISLLPTLLCINNYNNSNNNNNRYVSILGFFIILYESASLKFLCNFVVQ